MKTREVEFEVVGKDEPPPADPLIALIARWMDTQFVIPGTGFRFGLDPLIGLLPGLGDTATAAISLALILLSSRHRVPRIVLARMALNVVLNSGLGALPVVGDAFSFWFKSNARNYELLRRHAGTAHSSTRGEWVFVLALAGGVIAVLLLALAGVLALLHWLLSRTTLAM